MIKISLVDDDPSDRSFLHSLVSDSFEKTGIAVEKIFSLSLNRKFSISVFSIFI